MRFHQNLSEKLSRFAQDAKDYFIKNPSDGCAVYAGGDDFLGFINLNSLFSVTSIFREEFRQIDLSEFTDEKLTFSAGAVIAHYKTPLSEALKWSLQMEHEAKAGDKDALAIAVLKHSGDIHKTVYKWYPYGDNIITRIFSNIADEMANDNFSNTFIKNLDTEFRPLIDENNEINDTDLVESEIERLLIRSCEIKKSEKQTPEEYKREKKKKIEALKEVIRDLYVHSSFTNFLSALHIIDFFAQKAYRNEK
jgi:CRISPR-associated protein Cmr2